MVLAKPDTHLRKNEIKSIFLILHKNQLDFRFPTIFCVFGLDFVVVVILFSWPLLALSSAGSYLYFFLCREHIMTWAKTLTSDLKTLKLLEENTRSMLHAQKQARAL